MARNSQASKLTGFLFAVVLLLTCNSFLWVCAKSFALTHLSFVCNFVITIVENIHCHINKMRSKQLNGRLSHLYAHWKWSAITSMKIKRNRNSNKCHSIGHNRIEVVITVRREEFLSIKKLMHNVQKVLENRLHSHSTNGEHEAKGERKRANKTTLEC